MPYLVGEPPPPIIPIPPTSPTTLTWTSAAGTVTTLTNWQGFTSGIMTQPGVLGLHMPNWTFWTDTSPAVDGEIVRGVRAKSRQITVPLVIWGANRAECLTKYRAFVADLNPQRGPGTLTVTEADGTSRSIQAFYQQGLEGKDDDDDMGRTWLRAAIVLNAPAPFWLGEQISVTWLGAGGPGLFFPILPVAVVNSQVIGSLTVNNTGDVSAFPVWTIAGPATSMTFTNSTTGESFTLTHTITGTDTIVVDCRDSAKTILLNGTTNLWADVDLSSGEPVLWAFEPGANNINLNVPGSTSATAITMTYQPRYLVAY